MNGLRLSDPFHNHEILTEDTNIPKNLTSRKNLTSCKWKTKTNEKTKHGCSNRRADGCSWMNDLLGAKSQGRIASSVIIDCILPSFALHSWNKCVFCPVLSTLWTFEWQINEQCSLDIGRCLWACLVTFPCKWRLMALINFQGSQSHCQMATFWHCSYPLIALKTTALH